MDDIIKVPNRNKNQIDIDINHYVLIRLNRKKNLIEARIIKVKEGQLEGKFMKNEDVVADYAGTSPEDLYYKIIEDDMITNFQHAAYLGSELRKAYIALKQDIEYVQDQELCFE